MVGLCVSVGASDGGSESRIFVGTIVEGSSEGPLVGYGVTVGGRVVVGTVDGGNELVGV